MAAGRSDYDGEIQPRGYSAFVFDARPLQPPPSLIDHVVQSSLPDFSPHISQPQRLNTDTDIHQVDCYGQNSAVLQLRAVSPLFPQSLSLYPQISSSNTSTIYLNIHRSDISYVQAVSQYFPALSPSRGGEAQEGSYEPDGRVSELANPSCQQRGNRCLNCQLDSANRGCSQYPLCLRCPPEIQDQAGSKVELDGTFLNWRQLLVFCADAINKLGRAPAGIGINVANHLSSILEELVRESHVADSINEIILEFSFVDRKVKRQNLVVIRPQEQSEMRVAGLEAINIKCRSPAIDLAQLDEFVKAGVWSPDLWKFHDESRLTPLEEETWAKVRLFAGYLSLMHNLATTFIKSCGYVPEEIVERIVVELMFTLVWRLQMLWFEISSTFMELVTDGSTTRRPVVMFYTLEILYRLASTMCQSNWVPPEQYPAHPLSGLQHVFNQRVVSIVSSILRFECFASGKHQTRIHQTKRKLNPTPSLLEFARSAEYPSFPSHCLVTVYQNRRLMNSMPFSSDTSSARRIVDLLGCMTSSDVLPTPGRYFDDQNLTYTEESPFRSAGMASTLDSQCRAIQKIKAGSGGKPVVIIDTASTDGDTPLDLLTNQACDGSRASSGRGTPVPSLTHSTPASIPSPVTPLDLVED